MKKPSPTLRKLLNGLAKQGDSRGLVWCLALMTQSVSFEAPHVLPTEGFRLAFLWAQGAKLSVSRIDNSLINFTDFLSAMSQAGERVNSYANGHLRSALRSVASLILEIEVPEAKHSSPQRHHLWAMTSVLSAAAWGTGKSYEQQALQYRNLVLHQISPVAHWEEGHPLLDWVLERRPLPTRVGFLGDALERARRWRLRWHVPAERAIAERLDQLPDWWSRRRV